MIFSNLWARITGADKKIKLPNQQVSALGRIGDQTIVFPYCLFADLPNDTLLKQIAPGVFVPVTIDRPDDLARGEPVFFHPKTNARIIARNNGDWEIIPGDGGKVIINSDVQLGGAGGAAIARVGDTVSGGVITGGSANHTAT